MKVETKEFTLLTPFVLEVKDATVSDITYCNKITISGCANFAGLDDNGKTYSDLVNEIVVPSGIDTSVWSTNPQILWQHDRDLSIGKGISVEKRPDGIYITAEIHADAMDPQDYYRIKSGLVCMFSLGFKTISGEWKNVDDQDIWYITKSLLLECSVVTIPANSKSSFSVVKSLTGGDFTADKTKCYTLSQKDREGAPMNIKVKRAELLSAEEVNSFKSLGGDVDAEVEVSLASFVKSLVAKEVAAIDAAKEAVQAEEKAAQEAEETRKAEEAAAEIEANKLAEETRKAEEEKSIAEEVVSLKEIIDSIKSALTVEEK